MHEVQTGSEARFKPRAGAAAGVLGSHVVLADWRRQLACGSPAWWRLGWTYRWLQAEEDFYDDTGGLRLSAARVAKLEGKPRSDEVFPRRGE